METKPLSTDRVLRASFANPALSREQIERWACPACDGFIPNDTHIGQYPGAISRRDNKTEICSPCGNREAFEDFFGSGKGVTSAV